MSPTLTTDPAPATARAVPTVPAPASSEAPPTARETAPAPQGAADAPSAPEPGHARKRRAFGLLGVLALLVVGYFGWAWWAGRAWEETDNAQVQADVVPILARVQGYVEALPVREDRPVAAGALVARLDDRDLRQRVAQAEADVATARAAAGASDRVGQASAQAAAARAQAAAAVAAVAAAEANAAKARQDVARYRPLAADAVISAQQFDQAVAAQRASDAQVAAAREQARAAREQAQVATVGIDAARSRYDAARAALEQARLQLSYARIVTPVAGIVGRLPVKAGQLVQPGTPLMNVVPLAGVWISANLKETQVGRVQPGDSVRIAVDAYPGREFTGVVESLSAGSGATFALLPPDNATGNFTKVVQRIPVRIRVVGGNTAEWPLRPGMSVTTRIRVQ